MQHGQTTNTGEAGRRERMRQLALRPDGLRLLLRWLARQVGGHAFVIDADQDVRKALARLPQEIAAPAGELVRRVVSGKARSAALDLGSHAVYAAAVGEEDPRVTLVVAREGALPPMRDLLTDASGYLWLRWRVDELTRRRNGAEQADARAREAALHLLITGHVPEAKRVTAALGTRLPDITRVYVVECPPGLRDEAVHSGEQAFGRQAWLIRCPVYTRHLIILAPSRTEANRAFDDGLRSWAESRPGCYVGAGHAVPLRDLISGYEQAFHALAVARSSSTRCATFSPRAELPDLIDRPGHRWAYHRLRPLLDHRPRRRQDPDAGELTTTLASWLTFSTRAARQLKIHRNTLTARVRLVEELLDEDLHDLSTRAELDLALRALPRLDQEQEPCDITLDRLLQAPDVVRWARTSLDRISGADPRLSATLRTFLDSNANLAATAKSLGLSVPAVRKRLLRIEQVTKRSLLNGPATLYDLQLAFRAVDQHSPHA